MKNLYTILLLVFALNANAGHINLGNLTGQLAFLVNQAGTIEIPLGNTQAPATAYNIDLPAGLYRFKYIFSSTNIHYGGGIGFPIGQYSKETNFINVPAGKYDFFPGNASNQSYQFLPVTTWRLKRIFQTINLLDMGDGSYCALNTIISNSNMLNNWDTYFYFQHYDSSGTTSFGISSFPNGQLIPTTSTSFLIPDGTYDICINSDMSVEFGIPLNLQELTLEKIDVYPNPTENEWKFKLKNNSISSVSIYNVLGKKVYESKNLNGNFSVDSSLLLSGIYFAHIISDKDLTILKLIKK